MNLDKVEQLMSDTAEGIAYQNARPRVASLEESVADGFRTQEIDAMLSNTMSAAEEEEVLEELAALQAAQVRPQGSYELQDVPLTSTSRAVTAAPGCSSWRAPAESGGADGCRGTATRGRHSSSSARCLSPLLPMFCCKTLCLQFHLVLVAEDFRRPEWAFEEFTLSTGTEVPARSPFFPFETTATACFRPPSFRFFFSSWSVNLSCLTRNVLRTPSSFNPPVALLPHLLHLLRRFTHRHSLTTPTDHHLSVIVPPFSPTPTPPRSAFRITPSHGIHLSPSTTTSSTRTPSRTDPRPLQTSHSTTTRL